MLSIGLRVRTYLLTRKIHAVFAALGRVQIDKTSEVELLKTVPYLVLGAGPGTSAYRVYRVQIMSTTDRYYYGWTRWVPEFLLNLGRDFGGLTEKKSNQLGFLANGAYLLGWRYLSFGASVEVLNGTVSSTYYELEPDVFFGWPASNFVVARSTHAFWADRRRPIPVRSAEDENPYFRFGIVSGQFSWLPGRDSSIGVAYTPDAPRDLVSHAYQLDLSCFWGFRGCDSVRQVVPLLWKDRAAIEEATAARLRSDNPCPDQMLAGRVRTLLDLNVALLEVVKSRSETFNNEGVPDEFLVVDFRLVESIRGEPHGPWTNFRFRQTIPSPTDPRVQIPNPLWLNPQPGERFLYFTGANFASCRIVPATSSAEAVVRNTTPAPRRIEDDAPIGRRL
ncbi:MAG: hypothetical protein ACLPWF_23110 [Bryobacteraceae bacterium]